MALITMVVRKMLNQRWLMVSWLVGLLITVALVSSIPIYINGVMQNMLVQDVQSQQSNDGNYPGGLYDGFTFTTHPPLQSQVLAFEHYMTTHVARYVGLPVMANSMELDSSELTMGLVGPHRKIDYALFTNEAVTLSSFTGLNGHIRMVGGHMPSAHPQNGVYEVLVPQTTVNALGINLNQTYAVLPGGSANNTQPVFIKPVGEFTNVSPRDVYWRTSLDYYSNTFIMPQSTFNQVFFKSDKSWLGSAEYYTAFHYPSIRVHDVSRLNQIQSVLQEANKSYLPGQMAIVNFPVLDAFSVYLGQAQQLTLMMWSLMIPVLITLGVYIFMVSRLIVDRERTEISVLRSRGASRTQVIMGYLVEVGLLTLLSVVLGPFVALGLTDIVGASDGFLSFVSRVGLPVSLSREAFEYGLIAAIGCLLIVLLAAFLSTGDSIVGRKREMARMKGQAFWHKYFLDILLLAIAWYGWTLIKRSHGQLLNAHIDLGNGLQIDPISFFMPAVFSVGASIFCLRVYPFLIRGIHWVGKRYWPTPVHLGLLQVGRMMKQYQLFMMFLMMAVSIGGFSANAARTINQNLVNRIQYQDGADITLDERFVAQPEPGGRSTWIEPSYQPFTTMPGVIHASKVMNVPSVTTKSADGQQTTSTNLMAVMPYDFALTAWFQPSLLPYHWWGYLNNLSEVPNGALISQSLADSLGVKLGDSIQVQMPSIGNVKLLVEGVVKYWPTFNPLGAPDPNTNEPPTLVVANLNYVQKMVGVAPYSVWLKVKPGSTNSIYRAMAHENLPLIDVNSTQADIVSLKEDPFILGLNGSLTMGFLVVMLVASVGFLLFWLLNLTGRRQQYGIFRAIGLSLRKIVGMIGIEQLLTSGVACFLGGVIGWLASLLYVPQFDLYFSVADQVPPFQLFFRLSDTVRIYLFVAGMLVLGGVLITWALTRLRISQALKLGEDS